MTIIRFGGYQPERSVHTQAARRFGDALASRCGGEVEFRLTAEITKTGHQAADLLRLTESGDLEMCYFASSYLADRVPELGLLDLPFPGVDRARMWARLDGAPGRRIAEAVSAKTAYRVLGYWDNGIRHISNGVRVITHPRDCAGLSIRTLDNRFHQALFSALGFVPRYLDVKELAAAVRERTIDAQENPLTNIVNFDIHKTHRFVSLTGQFHGIALLLANAGAMRRWAPRVDIAVREAAAEATTLQRDLAAAEDEACRRLIEAEGVSVTAVDQSAFDEAVASVVAREMAMLDAGLLAAWLGS